jgi:hypothetical protein
MEAIDWIMTALWPPSFMPPKETGRVNSLANIPFILKQARANCLWKLAFRYANIPTPSKKEIGNGQNQTR